MNSLTSLAAIDCNVPEEWVEHAVSIGPARVKLLKIAKRNSDKKRIISRPSAELEILQRWLTIKFFNPLPIHDFAMAFCANRSILKNAQAHTNSKYFIRIDFTDFFHSIRAIDLFLALKKFPSMNILSGNPENINFIQRICFNNKNQLPIGYISSPVISNIVMIDFDERVAKLITENRDSMGDGVFTRYADDIVFSTDIKGGCAAFLEKFELLVNGTDSPKLTINKKKTIYSSKAGGSAMVTGLRICNDSHITITREYKDRIRLLLSLYAKKELSQTDVPILRGHLSYAKSVAPAFYSKICVKFIDVIGDFIP